MLLRKRKALSINNFVLPDALIANYPEKAEKLPTFALLKFRAKRSKEIRWLFGWLFEDDEAECGEELPYFETNDFWSRFNYNKGTFDVHVVSGAKGHFENKPDEEYVVDPYPLFYMNKDKKGGYKFVTRARLILDLGCIARKTGFELWDIDNVLLYFTSKKFCKTKISGFSKFFLED